MPRKFVLKRFPAIPEHLELVRHRVHRLALDKGFTAEHLLRKCHLEDADEFKRLLRQKYPPMLFLRDLSIVLACELEYLTECIPTPAYKVPRGVLRKLLSADDRSIDRFAGFRLNPELRRFARAKLAEIQMSLDAKRPAIDFGREPYIIEEAKKNLVTRYELGSVRRLELYMSRSDRWRDELEAEADRLRDKV